MPQEHNLYSQFAFFSGKKSIIKSNGYVSPPGVCVCVCVFFIVVKTHESAEILSVQYGIVGYRHNVVQQVSRTHASCRTKATFLRLVG